MREWLSGRASPCQGERREFESRLPLHKRQRTRIASFVFKFNNRRHSQEVRQSSAKALFPSSNLGGASTSEQVTLVPIFYCIKNQSPAALFLLFRKKARSAQLLTCKRICNVSLSLPPFCEYAFGIYLKGSHCPTENRLTKPFVQC